jgi:hypothetical protein
MWRDRLESRGTPPALRWLTWTEGVQLLDELDRLGDHCAKHVTVQHEMAATIIELRGEISRLEQLLSPSSVA